ncbi:hypothetical protein AB0P02_12590 [Streptomyces griseoluteus]
MRQFLRSCTDRPVTMVPSDFSGEMTSELCLLFVAHMGWEPFRVVAGAS